MAARKTKPKKSKKKKEKDADAPKQELDAVKGFIFIMILLILALGVFLVSKLGDLDEVETDLANARRLAPKVQSMSLEIQAYLDLIKNSDETVLLKNPNQFFKTIYSSGDVGAQEKDVDIGKKREQRNSRERYTETSWDVPINNLNREQATHFMWWVEKKSPKAKTIEVSLRRTDDEQDIWDTRFRVGYRIVGTK